MANIAKVFLVGTIGLFLTNLDRAHADFGTAAVLPKGRHQVSFQFGSKLNVHEKFNAAGSLNDISRMNKRMDNAYLKSIPQFKEAFEIINQMFPNQKIAERFDPGTLEFRGSAKFNYFAPQIARGITNRWTLGVGIPIVTFKSNVNPHNGGINRTSDEFSKIASPDKIKNLHEDLAYMQELFAGGPKALFTTFTRSEGYNDVKDMESTFIGDIIIGSIYHLSDTKYWDVYIQNYLNLPTGPEDDPDNLVDPSVFHKRKLETHIYNNIYLGRKLQLGASVGYSWNINDTIVKRVPANEGDVLPVKSSKEKLDRNPGDEVILRTDLIIGPFYNTEIGLGYEKTFQESDRYSGIRGQRYDLLEKDTDSETDVLKFKISYTTVDSFMQGISRVPLSFTYAYSDIIEGKNVEREVTHELIMKMYF